MSKRRVVVSGLGVVSSVGIGQKAFWRAISKGKSGISKISSFDTKEFKCHYGGEVKKFKPQDFISPRRLKFLGKTSQLAIAASDLAIKDAQLPVDEIQQKKFGVIIGTTIGERPMEKMVASWAKGGLKDVDRVKVLQASVNTISANVGIQFKAMGYNCLLPTACAAGNYAIGHGFDLIKNGDLNFALVGGAEAFSYLAYVGFQRLYAMSPDVCRPFDKNRLGMMLGEGSGILLLETLESAKKRGAKIYTEVLGYGLSCDAYHPTAPDPKGIARAMANALKDANIEPGKVDYICTHGTGTAANDKCESQAIKDLFGKHSKKLAISSIKSMLGHTMGASSAIESIACCLAVDNGLIPPTINYETPDPECDLDCVPNVARKQKVNIALNNGFAFGGNNCCVLFGVVNAK